MSSQPPSDAEIERQIIEDIGVKLAGILKNNSPNRIHGMLTAKGRNREWEKALEHISDHFKPLPGKPSHNIFVKKLRDADTLKKYIKQAVSGPSTVRLSKLTDAYGTPNGIPCVLIVRNFLEPIGEDPRQVCLVVIADFQGKLVTVYPATEAMLS